MSLLITLCIIAGLFEPFLSDILNGRMSRDFLSSGRAETSLKTHIDYNYEGHELITQEKFSLAADKFRQAIEAKPSLPEGYRNLAWCLYKMGKYRDAHLFFEKGLERETDDSSLGWYYGSMGQNYIYLKEYEKAREMLDKAMVLMPKESWIFDNLGIAYYFLEEYEKAYQSGKKAVELMPNDPWCNYNLGLFCAKLGKTEEAIRKFRKAISHNFSGRSYAYQSLILQYQELGDTENAWEVYREWEDIDPEAAQQHETIMEPEVLPEPSI